MTTHKAELDRLERIFRSMGYSETQAKKMVGR